MLFGGLGTTSFPKPNQEQEPEKHINQKCSVDNGLSIKDRIILLVTVIGDAYCGPPSQPQPLASPFPRHTVLQLSL